MSEGLKRHLPVIVVVTLICLATAAFALSRVLAGASDMSARTFSLYIIVIPCAIMVVGAFAISFTAEEIGRQLFLTVVGICFVLGVACMVVTSTWMSDATIASQLLANSGDGAEITPILDSPLIILRDLAAFVVAPTVGLIAGAWVGSRVHPMRRGQ